MKGTLYGLVKTRNDIQTKSQWEKMMKEVSSGGAFVIDGANIAADTIYGRSIVASSITADKIKAGEITSDHITAQGISGDKIKAGVLRSQNNVSYFDMNNGTFSFANGNFSYDGSTMIIRASQIELGGDPIPSKDYVDNEIENISLTPGKSAYDIAKANGYTGTEAQWVESLKGKDGAIYWINASTNAIKKDATGVISPNTITFSGFSKTGTANPVAYAGRFIIQTSTDGVNYTTAYTSTANQTSYTYTVPITASFVKARYYLAGGTSILLDEKTIPVLVDAEGIQIGTRNYIKNPLEGFIGYNTNPTLANSGTMTFTKNANGGLIAIRVTGWAPENATYTISGIMKKNGIPVKRSEWTHGIFNTNMGTDSQLFLNVDDNTGYFEGAQTWSGSSSWVLHCAFDSFNTGDVITIEKFMMTKGNKPVDWQLAPEDEKNSGANLIIRKGELKGYLASNGVHDKTVGQHAVMKERIAVTPNEILTFSITESNMATSWFRWNWYGEDGAYLSRTADSRDKFQWTVPSDAYEIWVSYPSQSKPQIERGSTVTDWSPNPIDDITDGVNHYVHNGRNITTSGDLQVWEPNNPSTPYGFMATGSNGGANLVKVNNVIDSIGYWTLSWDMRGNQNTSVAMRASIAGINESTQIFRVPLNNEWDRYYVTAYVDVESFDSNKWVSFYFTWAFFYIKNIKVEKGRFSTDFTLSPQDKLTEAQNHAQGLVDNIKIGGRNLISRRAIEKGKYLDHPTGSVLSATTHAITGFIAVKPNTEYILSAELLTQYRALFYTSDRVRIDGSLYGGNQGQSRTFTTPSNCYWMRFSGDFVNGSPLEYWMFEEGNKPSAHRLAPEDEVINRNLLLKSGEAVQNSDYMIKRYDLAESIADGTTITLTIWGNLASAKTYWGIYSDGGTTRIPVYPDYIGNGIYRMTAPWKASSVGSNNYMFIYTMFNAATGLSRIDKIKLEYGDIGTDWNQAPEDVELEQNKKVYNPVRYVRDWLNGSSANTSNHWCEIKVNDTNGTNVAKGKTVTTNGTATNLSLVTDGIVNATYSGTGIGKHYVEIDLGSVYHNIASVSVWHYYPDNRTYYETRTEVSEDRVNWYPIFDSLTEGTYAETESGKAYPNTRARAEALISAYNMSQQLATSTSKVVINGGNITAGTVKSANSDSWINLDNGQFSFGKGNMVWNGSNLTVKGNIDASSISTGTLSISRIPNLSADKITSGSIAAARIAANTITSTHIASRTITTDRIATNAITANEINVSTLSAITANLGTITAGLLKSADGSTQFNLTTGEIKTEGLTTSGFIGGGLPANNVVRATFDSGQISLHNTTDSGVGVYLNYSNNLRADGNVLKEVGSGEGSRHMYSSEISSKKISLQYYTGAMLDLREKTELTSSGLKVFPSTSSYDYGIEASGGSNISGDSIFNNKLTINGSIKMSGGIESIYIPANSNLNNYQTPGFYYNHANAEVATIANTPTNLAFSLLVEKHAGIKQTFTAYGKDTPFTYIRNNYGGSWGEWYEQMLFTRIDNSNGQTLRYLDGTQICLGKASFAVTAQDCYIVLPATYANTDFAITVNGGNGNWNTTEDIEKMGFGPSNTGGIRVRKAGNLSFATTTGSIPIYFMTIGRWK